ncbi:hypothetical protein LOZ61_006838 [Ophidiomyces ophidiicola]|nr:hypothetical protein LOZ61_006838 [Ophidiomyces ophidiicola]KAI1919758.1 hypothetical protein LOZ60_006764 [Ophidiomyces ophidiicola]KAI1946549.1 hypothetical protein LOZ59_006796 [Ophidiomyces ophidiicola]KAI2143193.1 hypothetical protein LOZ27_003956 [Ophidiomyces ophidiicola]KAI2229584.1 hypothetical protein LOZ13_006573 [Ophidiomyces ophidiicola]
MAEVSNKRPRSPTADFPAIASKVQKTSNHLQINYLARQYAENLPLVSADDTLPAIVRLIGEYDGVLQRHESIAGNLGACPLGPILVKRFERLFDNPPRVLKSNGKEGTQVSWLDVVEFAKSKPEQFNLEKTRNGVRVCQIYIKQSRVEISEEDYVLIASGMPQKMIPPQPISEDEEKELGSLEILEKNLSQIIQLADQGEQSTPASLYLESALLKPAFWLVSARARQLNHRLKNRRNAIISRRENDTGLAVQIPRPTSPWKESNGTGVSAAFAGNGQSRSLSPPSGFLAVNTRSEPHNDHEHVVSGAQFAFSQPNTDNVTIINGTSIKGASPSTRAELMKKFFTTSDRRLFPDEEIASVDVSRHTSRSSRPRVSDPGEYMGPYAPVAIPSTPSSLLPQTKSANHYERDDGGPYKSEMVSRMETLQRGERVLPPCDRCRRLHMDCLKNLTACMGCTKKHAKCSWKEVRLEELRDLYPRQSQEGSQGLLQEGHEGLERTGFNPVNADTPAPTVRPASEPQLSARASPPQRSLSENMVSPISDTRRREPRQHDHSHMNGNGHGADYDLEDPPDPLAQAILDTMNQHHARSAAERERVEAQQAMAK